MIYISMIWNFPLEYGIRRCAKNIANCGGTVSHLTNYTKISRKHDFILDDKCKEYYPELTEKMANFKVDSDADFIRRHELFIKSLVLRLKI